MPHILFSYLYLRFYGFSWILNGLPQLFRQHYHDLGFLLQIPSSLWADGMLKINCITPLHGQADRIPGGNVTPGWEARCSSLDHQFTQEVSSLVGLKFTDIFFYHWLYELVLFTKISKYCILLPIIFYFFLAVISLLINILFYQSLFLFLSDY